MDNPQDLKKLLIQQLIADGKYDKALSSIDEDSTELKDLLTKQLIADGKYETVLKSMVKEEKEDKLSKQMTPLVALAELLTENTKGSFGKDITSQIDEKVAKNTAEMRSELEAAHTTLGDTLKASVSASNDSMTADMLIAVAKAQSELQTAQEAFAARLIEEKADEILPSLIDEARLTPDEIETIVNDAVFSVETQLATIIGDYVAEAGITTSQITDFKKAVRELLPKIDFSKAVINWSQIKGAPATGGGTNALVVQSMIDTALAPFATSKDITYNADGTFNSSTDAFGSKTAVYGTGLVLSLVGTGIYKTKTLTYNAGKQLTNITV